MPDENFRKFFLQEMKYDPEVQIDLTLNDQKK